MILLQRGENMPDMTEAKKIVARRFRALKGFMIFDVFYWLFLTVMLMFSSNDGVGGRILLLTVACLFMFALPFIPLLNVLKEWRAARRDLKNCRLIQKQVRLTVVRYQSGYRGSFSAHVVDSDCEKYVLAMEKGLALSLSYWLNNIPATIEYLESSHIAVAVCFDIPSTTIIPKELLPLFEDRKGYTRFVKGKKKENT